ncbi:hypothetical protein SAMN02745121_07321 [Nannocystis exedens]|uniref:Uncharacterized protein n=1 Tax=Nannocystis exedens TaxID=54 RepID=A0A1I2GK54_9BACT|nr:hypothetical protein [Nannocystis exedens]PCC73574.1 hypothetical protein NAEX_06662 [Nannocystis exedens]SFF17340.1 hypothetical protein SAMN02745121_07321 [Nannocystis exedens]
MWIFHAATTALQTALLAGFAAAAEPETVVDLDEAFLVDESGEAARDQASLVYFIDDSQGLDLLEDGAVRLAHRGDFVVLRGPSQIEVKVTQGERGGATMTTSYIIRRIDYGTLYRLTNNETSGWDIDIEVRLLQPG